MTRHINVFSFALIVILTGCSERKNVGVLIDSSRSVEGTVYLEQPIGSAYSAGYKITVNLSNVSKMDSAATVISSTFVTTATLPTNYSLAFNASEIDPRMSYALQARIVDDENNLIGITDQLHRYTLSEATIRFDLLVKPVQLKAAIPTQRQVTCGEDRYSFAIYPSLLVKTDLVRHNRHILSRVVSASGEHFASSSESIFMKGSRSLFVAINAQRVNCSLK
jgi:uncharacterized lipoprotein YbaY